MKSSENKPSIVAVMAHPDDFAHSMGGTATLLKKHYNLHILCATRGERGIKTLGAAEAAAIRQKEEMAACDLLGAHLTFLDRINGELFADRELCENVASILKQLAPVSMFTLWPINEHVEHTAVYDIALQAIRIAGLYDKTEIYLSENVIGGQTNQFIPDLYVDISDVVEEKRTLVRCHASQNPTEESVERVVERNRVRGMFCRCAYAEAFKTIYPLTANGSCGRAGLLFSLGGRNLYETHSGG